MAQCAVTETIPNDSVALEHFFHMFLKCHMCNDEFDEGKKHARLLPCLHSLCFECLIKTKVNDQLQCPTCNVTHSVSNVDETCPRDNTRRDLMDFVKVKHSLMTVCCSVCPSEIATHRCTQCAEFLCDDCQKAHMRVSATKNHSLFELAELKKSNNEEAFCRPLMCSKHPESALNNYCTKSTCQKPVCVNCAIDSCREANDHKIENIDCVANAKRQLIKDQISSTEDMRKQIQSVINDIKDEQNKILNIEKSVEDEIDKTFDDLERLLWNRRVELKKTLKRNVLSKQNHLKAQEGNLRRMNVDIEESNKFANQAMSCPSSPALLQVYQAIKNRLHSFVKQSFDKKPHEMATFGFNTKGLNSEFQTKLVEMANIWSVSVFSSNCKAELGDFLEKNKSETFYVKLRDFQNHAPFKESRLNEINMDVIVKDSTGNETKCMREMRKKSNDELEITVKPALTGRHILEIRILGRVVFYKTFESKPSAMEMSRRKASYNNVSRFWRDIPKLGPAAPFGIQKPDMTFDRDIAHKDVSISTDGKVFKNISAGEQREPVSIISRLNNYKDALCAKGIKYPGRYYYAIKMKFIVKKPLDQRDLVYELGIARKSVNGNDLVVEREKCAWSMIGRHHVHCDAICLCIIQENNWLYHEVLTKNEAGSSMEKIFGFLLDTEFCNLKIFDHKLEKRICIVESVNCSEFVFPMVVTSNPYNVEVTATFVNV